MTSSRRPSRRRSPEAVVLAVAATALTVHGSAQRLDDVSREILALEAEAQQLSSQPIQQGPMRSATHVEERLTDGELFYRLQDFVRASVIFTDIVDNYPNHRAYPDALFLLGDSLFRAGDYLGARTRFREILNRADDLAFQPYVQRALGRLIEIAIHTRDFSGVEEYFIRLSRLPPSEIEAATAYYRAKYLYSRAAPNDPAPAGQPLPELDTQTLDASRQAFEGVAEGSPYYLQSRYFIGVLYTLRGQYPQAIEAFRRVLRGQVQSEEQERVVELAQLALGRLYYETDQLNQAVEAYQTVPRTSSNFDVALYEIAWVFIRQGDSTRAERALEVLSVAAPESRFIPDGQLLRGNLLLRNGRFTDANEVFRAVRREFGPVRRELDQLLEQHGDAQTYFRDLVRQNMSAFDANAFLPPLAVRWAQAEGDMDRALTVLGDLSQARQLVDETGAFVERLNAALNSTNRVNVFADLRRDRQMSISLRTRLARARQKLIAIEGRDLPVRGGSEIEGLRAERHRLERVLGRMPTGVGDFAERNDEILGRYRLLQRELRNLEVELMGVEARIVATDRYLRDTAGQRTDPSSADATFAELETHRGAVTNYHEQIEHLNRQVEVARVQVGVGDARHQRDDRLRGEYNGLVERERRMIAAAGIQSGDVASLFGRVGSVESMLDQHDRVVDAAVEERTAEILAAVQEESAKLANYQASLSSFEGEAEEVIGAITHDNFKTVRQRFYDLVLRADVGRVDIAWAEREEHRARVDMLTRERSREIKVLDDEFREIMDEQQAGEEEGAGAEEEQPR